MCVFSWEEKEETKKEERGNRVECKEEREQVALVAGKREKEE